LQTLMLYQKQLMSQDESIWTRKLNLHLKKLIKHKKEMMLMRCLQTGLTCMDVQSKLQELEEDFTCLDLKRSMQR